MDPRTRLSPFASVLAAVLVALHAAPVAVAGTVVFEDGFDVDGAIEEVGSPASSASADWWVSSGAWLERAGGVARTVHGALAVGSRWQRAYAASNPVDTEDGQRPQNVFRLVTRGRWSDFEQQLWFRVTRTNLTDSPNRDAWNGVQLFLRHQGSDDVYTAGLRVDGKAAIKRKRAGRYVTLGYAQVYPGRYDRAARPNVLPEARWIGLRAAVRTTATGGVVLVLDVEDPAIGPGWTTVLSVEDTSVDAILGSGSGGLRTDFLDVELEGYSVAADGAPAPAATPTRAPTAPAPTPTPRATATPRPTATPVWTPTPQAAPTRAAPKKQPTPIVRFPPPPIRRFPW